ncbi:1680_t:CDS:2 [Racocetra fulgida]|uniref:1680_t:CDS:1 n=1 Tax=Racocetra fulgida TaxID=60492 RepID=A0A9N9EX65_9GLOM|nr:1680_t:CDS:2 [Racocetra fulgida]
MGFSDEQQKSSLLNQLDNILEVPEVKLSDIKVSAKIIGKEQKEKKKLIIKTVKLEA